MEKWSTSITSLMDLLLESYKSLIPTLNKAHINFSEIDSYDDWDGISEALFNSIVITSIQNSNIDVEEFCKYGLRIENYKNKSAIAIKRNLSKDFIEVFVNYDKIDNIIPRICFCKVDKYSLEVISYSEILYKDIEFVLVADMHNPDNIIEHLEVSL